MYSMLQQLSQSYAETSASFTTCLTLQKALQPILLCSHCVSFSALPVAVISSDNQLK